MIKVLVGLFLPSEILGFRASTHALGGSGHNLFSPSYRTYENRLHNDDIQICLQPSKSLPTQRNKMWTDCPYFSMEMNKFPMIVGDLNSLPLDINKSVRCTITRDIEDEPQNYHLF